jgi:hypothetical protein
MVQLYSHDAFSSSIGEWVISTASPLTDRTLSKPLWGLDHHQLDGEIL